MKTQDDSRRSTVRTKTTTRLVTLDVDGIDFDSIEDYIKDAYSVGAHVCLVEVTPQHNQGRTVSHLTREPRTNLSHEVREEGWLGNTNGHSYYARGVWEIRSIDAEWTLAGEEQRYRVRLAQVS